MFLWDIVQLVLLIVLTLLVLSGWGRIGLLILRIQAPTKIDIYIWWLGFSLIVGFLEIIHLFFAIDWRVTLLVTGIGITGLFISFNIKRFTRQFSALNRFSSTYVRVIFIIGCSFFIILILRSMGLSNNYDSGIYHFGSIRWVNEYPIVPGLGNVFSALAYNQSYFLYLGLLNFAPYWNHGYALGSLTMLLMTGLTLAQFCIRSPTSLRWAFGVPIFIFLGYLGGSLSNPSPDSAVSLLQIVMFLMLVTLYNSYQTVNEQRQLLVSTLIILSITVVTIKVSSAMFALMTLALTLSYAGQSFFHRGKWKSVLWIGLIIGATHLTRGYLLSGAPLYPSEIGSVLTLPWAMSRDAIFGERFWIYIWSRLPGAAPAEVIGTWAWLPQWIAALSFDVWIFTGVLVSLTLVNIWLLTLRKAPSSKYRCLMLTLPMLSSIVFWFMSAPQIRFLGAIPLLLLSLNLWILFEASSRAKSCLENIYFKHHALLELLVIMLLCLISLKLIGLRSISLEGWTPIPSVSTKDRATQTGLVINMPLEGNQCWNTPLPCSPQVKDELDLMRWPSGVFIFDLVQERPIYRLKY